jgi:hypothetical protein
MAGFEPTTLRSQSGCATKLRHIPSHPEPWLRNEIVPRPGKLSSVPASSGHTRV